jgi:S1-C subfamily serine protease
MNLWQEHEMSNGQNAEFPEEPREEPRYEWGQPQSATPFGPVTVAERPHHRRRGALVGGVAAVIAVGALVGATRAGDGSPISLVSNKSSSSSSASYLTTNTKTVAGSVSGAIVDIVSTEKYEGATAAGTGLVMTSDGEILTNNHVVDGATSIKVTVTSTGKSYTANVVGTDATDDIAVLQLVDASGLKTMPIGDSDSVKVGDKVTAQGNAGGVGGTPSKVTGSVTALDQSITASDEGSSDSEQLSGLIETDAAIVAGDSGGPLSIGGQVIGIDTAASASNGGQTQFGGQGFGSSSSSSSTSEGYAIPIKTALTIAHKIVTGQASSTIHIGLHGFLGVELATENTGTGSSGSFGGQSQGGFGGGGFYGSNGYSSGSGTSGGTTTTTSGATISGVVSGGASEAAGLSAGDVITKVDSTTIDSATTLDTAMADTKPGQKISVTYTDTSGTSHTTTVTLGTAAAD